MRSTTAVATVAQRLAHQLLAGALATAVPGWITCGARACQSSGNCSSTSGRASASTMKRWSRRLRSAASTKLTVPRSPQCRSSSTSSTGCAAHSAASQSSQARRMASPISCGLARAARSASLCVVGERNVGDLAQERGRRARARRDRRGGRRARPACRACVSIGLALVDAGRAPDRAPQHRERRARAQRIAAAEQHLAAVGLALHPVDELLAQARLADARPRPMTSTADAIDSASVPGVQVVSIDISRPRPTKSVALPSRLRLTSNTSRSPRRNGAVPSRRISKRASSSPTATSSRRIAPGGRPAQQAHAVVDHLARHRPGREAPRPGRHHQRHVGQHRAHRQRAAGGARRLIGRLADVGQRQHHRAVGQRVQRAPRARARSSSSSAASRRSCAARQAVVRSTRRERRGRRPASAARPSSTARR